MTEDIPRAALVTGAAKRVGRALALDLARDGWAVAIHYAASRAEAEQTAAEIEAEGGRAVTLQADLTEEGACAALVDRAASALGAVGLLVNNAAVFEYDTAETVTRASWDRHLETNLRAPFVLAQGLRRRLPQGRQGMIVNLLDGRSRHIEAESLVTATINAPQRWLADELADAGREIHSIGDCVAPRLAVMAIHEGRELAQRL